jgi:2-oxoisovalerate dehydrogenase E1 component
MRGHEEARGTKYPQELMDLWAAKDPVENYVAFKRKRNPYGCV